MLTGDLCFHQSAAAISFTQHRLFDLAGGISGDAVENDLFGALVTGQAQAEGVDLFFCAGHIFLDFYDGCGDLAQAGMGQANDSHVLDLFETAEEVFNLDR